MGSFSSKKPQPFNINLVPKKSFYFVRHGETNWGKDDILKGPQDLSLNENGMTQAKLAGDMLNQLVSSDTIIISSGLKRAIETATEISKITNFPLVDKESNLNERYYGDYRLLQLKTSTNTNTKPPDAESLEIFKNRVLQCLIVILNKYHDSQNLIIVSHQKVFQCINKILGGNDQQRLDQGGICYFIPSDNNWTIKIQ